MTVKKMSACALMSCIMVLCSWISVPFAVPFTLQLFAVFFAVLFLGGKFGTVSTILYVLLGAVGLPVFSGFGGGLGHLFGPTGGYIIGFVAIGLVYWVFEPLAIRRKTWKVLSLSLGLLLCYIIGTLWFAAVNKSGFEEGFISGVTMCVLPYVIPDVGKMILALICGKAVRNRISNTKTE